MKSKIKMDRVTVAFLVIFFIVTLFLFVEYVELTKSFLSYKVELVEGLKQATNKQDIDNHIAIIQHIEETLVEVKLSSIAKFLMAAVVFFVLYVAYQRQRNVAAELNQYKSFVDKVALVSKADVEGKITDANNAFVKISGYSKDELIGSPHSIVRHPGVSKEFFKGLWKRLKEGKSWSGKFTNLSKKGKEYIVHAHIFPIFNKDGKIVEYIAIRHDITKLEQAKQNQEKMLLHQSKLASIGEMVDSAAHQWKQPINIIRMKIDMLGYDFEDGEVDAKYIKDFQNSTKTQFEHMENTLNAFRNFLRPDTHKELFSLEKCCENVMLLIKDELMHHQIYIHLEIKDDIQIYGIENEFKHLILNILSNAKDAFKEKKSEDKIITIEIYKEQNKGVLKIADNAGGIPPEILPNIFKANITSKADGTGMGMYMSKKIAKKHAGELTVYNSDIGAVFTFTKELTS